MIVEPGFLKDRSSFHRPTVRESMESMLCSNKNDHSYLAMHVCSFSFLFGLCPQLVCILSDRSSASYRLRPRFVIYYTRTNKHVRVQSSPSQLILYLSHSSSSFTACRVLE
ncbi:hypothetical protein BDN70DRAFT_825969, partial [Pholiota conissans]